MIIGKASAQSSGSEDENLQLANEYYSQAEFDKARILYEELAGNTRIIPLIHNNYFEILLNQQDYKAAQSYLKKTQRYYPDNIRYEIDEGEIIRRKESEEKAREYWSGLIDAYEGNQQYLRILAQNFIDRNLLKLAEQAFLSARTNTPAPGAYSLELATVYRLQGNKQKMVEEYLTFAKSRPENIDYVQNVMQAVMDEEDLDDLETYLLDRVQDNPEEGAYSEMLVWVALQKKDFYGAFIQSRAMDKRFGTQGVNSMKIGRISLENKEYETAVKVFDYLSREYPDGPYYQLAGRMRIHSREELVKNSYPVDTVEVRALVNDYRELIDRLGLSNQSLEAMRSKALLHAFYLDEPQIAEDLLKTIIATPRADSKIVSKSKIDLGDIYLLTGQPWESTLLYSQAEKAEKDDPIGYEAKLKNAKLNYYEGNFQLAQEHLDILKQATTRDIANDAMDLSLTIKDNTLLDTTDAAMQQFARVELMLFRNKPQMAMDTLNAMLEKYEGHSLTDEIWFLQADILRKLGQFQQAIDILEQIEIKFPKDILGDNAMYTKGLIYQEDLKDEEVAMGIFRDFLIRYPGSIFSADARKRFRLLRGDMVN
ncbi:tetratricopeptide repeat protein [Roseivirga sp. BDSF3-8]|uniref:tetratricopeptide repeat protein n=1 Tax=Roseivirga sp. BDSF3-8 TaxID=3241598 RepID=UPI0035320B9B